MTTAEAGRLMGWTDSKMSRIETANMRIPPQDVAPLLKHYGMTEPDVVAALEGLAKDAGKKGWWQTYSGLVGPAYADYISLEDDAREIRIYSPLLVPGLLQTADYAREIIAASSRHEPEHVNALADIRRARQAVLTRADRPVTLWAIINEAVLHQRVPGMQEQLQRLLDAAKIPGVTIQVMPLGATPHPGVAGGFNIVQFPRPMPDVVHLSHLQGASYVEGTDDVTQFTEAFDQIMAAALSVHDSLALITQLKDKKGTP